MVKLSFIQNTLTKLIFVTFLNIAIFQGIILGAIIFKSPLFKSRANKYLAMAIFTLSILLLNLVFEIVEVYTTLPYLRVIDNIEWAFIFPVFIFLFIVNQVRHPIRHVKKIQWLFSPFLFSIIINISNDLDVIAGIYDLQSSFGRVMKILNLIHLFIIPLFITWLIIYSYTFIKFSKNIQEKKWITILWTLVSVLLFSWILALLIGLFVEYNISLFMQLLALFATFLIHWTTYFGIYKYNLAKDKERIHSLLNNEVITIDSNHKKATNLEPLTKDNPYFKKLDALCREHKIYRDSSLNREKVAEKLGISAGYVSQLINNITGNNFANYINHYRIEIVKEMILDPEFKDYSLLAIGLESGFTSKTTFYNVFKKATGMTPNEYRKKHSK